MTPTEKLCDLPGCGITFQLSPKNPDKRFCSKRCGAIARESANRGKPKGKQTRYRKKTGIKQKGGYHGAYAFADLP